MWLETRCIPSLKALEHPFWKLWPASGRNLKILKSKTLRELAKPDQSIRWRQPQPTSLITPHTNSTELLGKFYRVLQPKFTRPLKKLSIMKERIKQIGRKNMKEIKFTHGYKGKMMMLEYFYKNIQKEKCIGSLKYSKLKDQWKIWKIKLRKSLRR